MKLRELMKLYGLKLDMVVVDVCVGERVSVLLAGVKYFEKHLEGCSERTFPGWGSTPNEAIKDYVSEMRTVAKSRELMSFVDGDGKTHTIPVPMITSF